MTVVRPKTSIEIHLLKGHLQSQFNLGQLSILSKQLKNLEEYHLAMP